MTVCDLIREIKGQIRNLVPVRESNDLSPIRPTQSVLQVNPVTGRPVVVPNIRNIPSIPSTGAQTNIFATNSVNRLVHLALGGIIPGYTTVFEPQRPKDYTQQYQQYFGYQRNRDKDTLSGRPRDTGGGTGTGTGIKKYGATNVLPSLRDLLWLRRFYSGNLYTRNFVYIDNTSRKTNIKINLRILPEGLYVGYETLIKNRFNSYERTSEEITYLTWDFLQQELQEAGFPKQLYLYDLKLEFRYKEWAPEYHQIIHKIYLTDKEIPRPREVVLDSELLDNWALHELNINNPVSLGLTPEEYEQRKPNLLIKLGEIVELDETIYDPVLCGQYYDYEYGEERWSCQDFFTGQPEETLLLQKFPNLPKYAPLFVNPKKSQLEYISAVEVECLEDRYEEIYNPWIDYGLRCYGILGGDFDSGYVVAFIGDIMVYSVNTRVRIEYTTGRVVEYHDRTRKAIYMMGYTQEYVKIQINEWPWYTWLPISTTRGVVLYFACQLRAPNGIYERKITFERIELDEGNKTIVPLLEQVRDIGKYFSNKRRNRLDLKIRKRKTYKEEEDLVEVDLDFILPEIPEDPEKTFLDYSDESERFKHFEEITEDTTTVPEEEEETTEEFVYDWPLPPIPETTPLPLIITIPAKKLIPSLPMATPISLPPIGGWQQVPGQLLIPPPSSTPASPITRLRTPTIPRNNIFLFLVRNNKQKHQHQGGVQQDHHLEQTFLVNNLENVPVDNYHLYLDGLMRMI
ncbi:MAG: hypothetical protein QXM92_01540 [Candidatus Anstonellales archaeon]